jgi:thiamine kinase-like enzyme
LAKYFSQGKWQVPNPIVYDKKTKALVYRELTGPNLYELFEQKQKNLDSIFQSFGQWIAKMHSIQPSTIFKAHDLSMDELDPAKILKEIKKKDAQLYKEINQMIKAMARLQKKMFTKTRKRVLVHGDLHPENVILISEKPELGLIDLENASLSDREQDLGSFLEQVEIMAGHRYDKKIVHQFKNTFLSSYLKAANIKHDPDMAKKILFYKSFFGLKGAIFYFRLGWFARMREILERVQKYISCLEGLNDYQECEI